MFEAASQGGVTIVRAAGDLGLEELASIAKLANLARREGRVVVVDLALVTHLHYAGATLLKSVPGVRVVGASRYVRTLVHAGGAAGYVELYPDLDQALHAA